MTAMIAEGMYRGLAAALWMLAVLAGIGCLIAWAPLPGAQP